MWNRWTGRRQVENRERRAMAVQRLNRVAPWAGLTLLFLGGCRKEPPARETPAPVSAAAPIGSIGCLGRILPEGGTFFVSPYTVGVAPPLVSRLDIQEGQRVAAGQPIAELSAGTYLRGDVQQAQTQVELAEARLKRTQTAGSPQELAASGEDVRRLRAARDEARREYEQNKPLYDKDYLSESQVNGYRTRLEEAEAALEQAQQQLRGLGSVRTEDVGIAQAQVHVAQAQLAQARQNASSAVVRSPADAVVLRVITHAGELVGPQGIAEFAKAGDLEIVADVYEADIARVRVGETAAITADFLPAPLEGAVQSLGSAIELQESLADSRGTPSDARILKVRIRIADQAALQGRMKGKVHVVIHL